MTACEACQAKRDAPVTVDELRQAYSKSNEASLAHILAWREQGETEHVKELEQEYYRAKRHFNELASKFKEQALQDALRG